MSAAQKVLLAITCAQVGCASVKEFPVREELSPERAIEDGAISTLVQGLDLFPDAPGQVDEKAFRVLSDGTFLYWVSFSGRLSAFPLSKVNAHAETLIENGVGRLIGVNPRGVYYISNRDVLRRLPSGVTENLTNDHSVQSATLRGNVLTWISETVPEAAIDSGRPVEARTIGVFSRDDLQPRSQLAAYPIAVTAELVSTSTTLFIGDSSLVSLSIDSRSSELIIPTRIQTNAMCDSLLADDDAAYCNLTRVENDGTVNALAEELPARTALDRDHLYFTIRHPKPVLYKIPKRGGEKIFLTEEDVRVVAVDDRAIYWITGAGDLRRMYK